MFEKVSKFWKKYGFEIIIGLCVLFIIIYAIMRRGKTGSWSGWGAIKDFLQKSDVKKREGRENRDSKGELECRKILEEIFKRPFSKARPDLLSNPVTGGNNLEFDCYNEGLKIACEYNGRQHYEYVPFFHRNKEAFLNQKYRDELKRRLCADNGIFLIEVPYTVKLEDIRKFIEKKLSSYKMRAL